MEGCEELHKGLSHLPKVQTLKYVHTKALTTFALAYWSIHEITMDFIEGLPKSRERPVILVVVDRLMKHNHFMALAHPFSIHQVA